MRQALLILGFLVCTLSLVAQTSSEKADVMIPINNLFRGMKQGDSSIVHNAFSMKVTMATISTNKDGTPSIRHEAILDGFLRAVGTPHPDV